MTTKIQNGLNNRRRNLRLATQSQNMGNQKKRSGTTSKFKGVYWDKHAQKWRACVGVHGKTIHLKCLNDERKAARAYNIAAVKYFGDFAYQNKV